MKLSATHGTERLFPSIPVCDGYLAIGSIEDARSRVCRMVDRAEGLAVVVGPPGTGKTLLCQRIAAQHRGTHQIVMVGDMRVSSRMGLMQQVLFQMRIPLKGLDEQAMQIALVESLTKTGDGVRNLLLIIDEAQMLTLELLDEIRMLTNLIRDGRQIVQTVLVGNSKLDDSLADPQLESLAQRIVARCYLHAFNQAETAQYVRSMLVTAGIAIHDDAVSSVHHACAGIPRLINQLMKRGIEFAASDRADRIDDMCIQRAWGGLQQLPSPVVDPKLKPRSSDIEFGELSGDDSAAVIEFAPKASLPTPNYFDIESTLGSSSIDCFAPTPSFAAPSKNTTPLPTAARVGVNPRASESIPVIMKTTNTTIAPPVSKAERKRQRDDLFGIDFSDEMLVDVTLADHPRSKKTKDPAAEEISLHGEILKLSHSANQASARPVIRNAALPWAPEAKMFENTPPLPIDSADVPMPMAVVWDEDLPFSDSADDRDMLVIEEDVTIMVDSPAMGIGGGAMRQPPRKIEKQYQDLFAKLRHST